MAYKLVVADASPSVQKAVALAFPAEDWEILPFDNGLELARKLVEIHPDGLLASLSLPGLDGYELGRLLHKHEDLANTALVLLKGPFESLDPEKAAGLRYDEIVTKPFDSRRLATLVRNLIDAKGEHEGFPEQPIPEEPVGVRARTEPPVKDQGEGQQAGPSAGPDGAAPVGEAAAETKLRTFLREEAISLEREMEKRVRSIVSQEVKKYMEEHPPKPPSRK